MMAWMISNLSRVRREEDSGGNMPRREKSRRIDKAAEK